MIKTEEALAMIGGHVDEELLLRNEYLAIENEILRKKVQGQVKLSQCERIRLATVGKKIGIKALRDVAMIVKPETILTWYRKLIASKFDSSKNRKKKVGRPLTDSELEALILQINKEIQDGDMIVLLVHLRIWVIESAIKRLVTYSNVMELCLFLFENHIFLGVTLLQCIKM